MKTIILLSLLGLTLTAHSAMISESVYVESPTDTDNDGKRDRIYVSISRPNSERKLSSIYEISPYSLGGNNGAEFHDVDFEFLPQDSQQFFSFFSPERKNKNQQSLINIPDDRHIYATVKAHSLGTGKSSGCPTIGDESEIQAAKAVIDWLNGRARAWDIAGTEVKADWSNGKVGMTGVSYNGTLPIMVASTGVEGLKAIIPVAAISNWYDYYRANGLVVGPGGYIGEDADVLGHYVVADEHKCKRQLDFLTKNMGRENGDFTPFWAARNHLANAKKIKAATFIIHGQSDWNVKQKHAILLWEALEGVVPRRMILHRGGHSLPSSFNASKKIQQWFDHFLEDDNNGITNGPLVEIEHNDGSISVQHKWPHENSGQERFYLQAENKLAAYPQTEEVLEFEDTGKTKKLDSLLASPEEVRDGRLVFLSETLERDRIISGTPHVNLKVAVMNRQAANLTIAIVEYKRFTSKIITRGWIDPQNFQNLKRGQKLIPGKFYNLSFDIEPKQQRISKGSRLGILVTSTDYDFTIRPNPGTKIQVMLGEETFVDLKLTPQ